MNLNIETTNKVSHRGVTRLSYEVTQILQNDPNRSPLFALLYAIYKGKSTQKELYNYFKYFYVNEFSYIRLTESILDDLLAKGLSKGLIQRKENTYLLTEKGNEIFIKSRKVILITNRAINIFFSEKIVLLFSLVCLIFMSSSKIIIGLNNGSDALFNEGIENLTDIIKIVIISLSIRFKKDKLGAILIITLMLITGINLIFTSIFTLLKPKTISPDYFSFVLMFISIIINLMLLVLKNFVGKIKANFALLSDAKDNKNNIRLSLGVTAGLIFALFGIYFVDPLIGLLIACLIIFDGIDTLIELIKSGDKMELESFKLKIDEAFEFKIAHWVLLTIHEENLSVEKLNDKFIEAIGKGSEFFGVWAIFGLYDFKKSGINKILNPMRNKRLFNEIDGKTYLTEKGEKQYKNALSQERKRILKETKKYQHWKPPTKFLKILWGCLGMALFTLLILFMIYVGPLIFNLFVNLI